MTRKAIRWWQKKLNLALVMPLLTASYFLIANHLDQPIHWLPWALILGCIYIDSFIHGRQRNEYDDRSGYKP